MMGLSILTQYQPMTDRQPVGWLED